VPTRSKERTQRNAGTPFSARDQHGARNSNRKSCAFAALSAAQGPHPPPANEVFDTPDTGFGFGIEKLHRAVFNEIRAHDAEALRLRADKLPPNGPRRLAFQNSRTDKSSNTLIPSMPDPRTPFTSLEFCSAVQNKAGAHQTALAALVGRPITSSAQTTQVVDPSGYNIKKTQGAKHDGTRQNHDAHVNAISKGLANARIQHKGGRNGNPRTCKNIFSGISAPTEGNTRAYQHIIPDLEINGRPLDEGPLAGKISLADVKTLSPCDAYTDTRPASPTLRSTPGRNG